MKTSRQRGGSPRHNAHGIFISYRREDTSGHAGRLYDALVKRFGRHRVFRDIDALEAQLGLDFTQALDKALTGSNVVLVLIGPDWLHIPGPDGRPRIDDPEDILHQEIVRALAREGTRVIPVLLAGASMPRTAELPDPLKPLTLRQAIDISDRRWNFDVGQLIEALEPLLISNAGETRDSGVAGNRGAIATALSILLLAASVGALFVLDVLPPGEADPTPTPPPTDIAQEGGVPADIPDPATQVHIVASTSEQPMDTPTGAMMLVPTVTPTATDTPPPPSPTATDTTIDDGVFKSTLYDYTVEFDEDIWTLQGQILNESSDGLVLNNELGQLKIWAWDADGADAEACLQGESDFYGSGDRRIEEWAPAEDADGNPKAGKGEGYAWGVFTLVYTNEDGEETDQVYFIECREIPGDDAVVIIFASAPPELYNDHLDQVLDVADAIEIEGKTMASDSGDAEEPVEPEEGETGLSGSLFTSPAFGFTVEIPSQWRIVDERLDVGHEELILTNGVSKVTLWATTEYSGDLAVCVDLAADESGLDLELDMNADGEPFRGEGRLEAYGNFRYVDDEGEEMMYFISCRYIVRGESVLILVQDVPYGEFTNQRKFRAEIENAIVMPG